MFVLVLYRCDEVDRVIGPFEFRDSPLQWMVDNLAERFRTDPARHFEIYPLDDTGYDK